MEKDISFDKVELENGEKLAYRKAGHGEQILLLIHGNTSSSKHWDLLMENISYSEFTVYAPDLRGFGESSYNNRINSINDFSEDIKLFCEELNLRKFSLIGWSAGGAVALRFTVDYQDHIKKLILLESSSIKGFPIYIEGEYLASRDEIRQAVKPALKAYQWKDKFILNKLARWTMKKICERSMYSENTPKKDRYNKYIDEMLKQRNLVDINFSLSYFNISHEHNGLIEGTGEVDKIEVPTLIIQGERDDVVNVDMAKEILNGIGENAELEIISGAGHSPLVDKLEETLETIISFLKEN